LLKIWGSLKFIGQLKVNRAAQKNEAAEKCWVVSLAHFRNSRVGPPKLMIPLKDNGAAQKYWSGSKIMMQLKNTDSTQKY
jgi:hypothetical protein